MSDDWSDSDTDCMRAAIREAISAGEAGEVPVGAIICLGGRIASRAHNRTLLDNDPSAHAEIVALREAAAACGNHRLTDATLVVTLEPCVMCVGAMVQARIRRLVFGAYDPKAGALGSVMDLSMDRRLNHRFEVNGGLLAEECGELLRAFFLERRQS